MVRPGEVVAQGLGREVPEEARARVAHLAQVREGVRDAQLQVLRRDQVRKVKGGIQVLGKEDCAVVLQRGAGDLRAGERRDLRRQLRLHGRGQGLARGDEDGRGDLVVLGLGHKVSREVNRVRSLICKY